MHRLPIFLIFCVSLSITVALIVCTAVQEFCNGDEASQWKRPKFDPSPHQNPLTIFIVIGRRDYVLDGTRHAKFCSNRLNGFCSPNTWFFRAFGVTSFFVRFFWWGFFNKATTYTPECFTEWFGKFLACGQQRDSLFCMWCVGSRQFVEWQFVDCDVREQCVQGLHGCCDRLPPAGVRSHGDVHGVWKKTQRVPNLPSICGPCRTRFPRVVAWWVATLVRCRCAVLGAVGLSWCTVCSSVTRLKPCRSHWVNWYQKQTVLAAFGHKCAEVKHWTSPGRTYGALFHTLIHFYCWSVRLEQSPGHCPQPESRQSCYYAPAEGILSRYQRIWRLTSWCAIQI